MKVSLEWVRDFVDLPADLAAADLAHELTLKTVEVEGYVDLARSLDRVVVGRVSALEPLDDQGRVVATCDVGATGALKVVTRAKGLSEGLLVAVAVEGARIGAPGNETTAKVSPVEIAGVTSEGVICTAADVGLQRLFPDSRPGEALDLSELNPPVGSPLAGVLGFDDVILEIDNKSLTNRPDLWGHYGIARELAVIYGRELKPLEAAVRPPHAEALVGELDSDLCRRLVVVEFCLDANDKAPLWMRSRLARIGEGSVNLCVDLSNYVMFTVGQPTHVYDSDRVALPLSVVRSGSAAKLELLTGESREVESSTPVITDASGPVAVAGVMGGLSSAVSPASRRFVLEAATFRPEPIRRVSQRLALRTEASARFEKGLDTQRVDAAVDLFLKLLAEAVPAADIKSMQDVNLDPTPSARIQMDLGFLDTRVGMSLDITEVRNTLTSLGFSATGEGRHLEITAPTWRSTGDVSLPHDIVEEVARIHGYDNLPTASLTVSLTPVRQLDWRPLHRVIREQLASRGDQQEVVTYPWVADHLLLATGLSKQDTLRFEGAPAPDRDSLRPSLVPNLLEAVVGNLRYSESFALFEVGTVFAAEPPTPYRGIFEPLPQQGSLAAGVIVGDDGAELFRRAKGTLAMLARYCHLTDLSFAETDGPVWADRSARLAVISGGNPVGAVGLLTKRCRRIAGIDKAQVACFELNLDKLTAHPSRDNRYQTVPELPEADFDLSFIVTDTVRWSEVVPTVIGANELIHRVALVDEFRGASVPEGHKSLTLRVILRPENVTLTAEDIAAARADVIDALARELNARLRL